MKKSGNKNSKNSDATPSNNSFEVLEGLPVDGETNTPTTSVDFEVVRSSRGRALKRTTPIEPVYSPPRKRTGSVASSTASKGPSIPPSIPPSKGKKSAHVSFREPASSSTPLTEMQQILQIIQQQNARIESLESLIRDELLPRLADPSATTKKAAPIPTNQPISMEQLFPPKQIPGIGLDLSRCYEYIRKSNAGVVRSAVNKSLEEIGVKCLGINDKGNSRFRLLFDKKDIDKVRRDDKWLESEFPRARIYGEQWYPLRLDRVSEDTAIDVDGCKEFGRRNDVMVYTTCQ